MSNLRDSYNVPLSAKSPELVALMEQATSELVNWNLNCVATIEKALEMDEKFIMGNVFRGVVEILSAIPRSPIIHQTLERCKSSSTSIWREGKHIEAFEALEKRKMRHATLIWEEILVRHPSDVLALKFAYDSYLWLGDSLNLQNSLARVYKYWMQELSNSKLFGNIKGMYAFGLEENNFFAKAENLARSALEINPKDVWAAHTIAHVLEMEGRQKEGIEFLNVTEKDWKDSGGLAIHNWWHKALYHLDLGESEEVIHIYDHFVRKERSNLAFNLMDASSLLFRCNLANIDVGDRWNEVAESWSQQLEDHFLCFFDLHAMMSVVGAKKTDVADKLVESMIEFSKNQDPQVTQARVARDVGIELARAIQNWGSEKYQETVHSILPVRHLIPTIGGSNAQRDLFHRLLVDSSLRGKDSQLASALLSERLEAKPNQPQYWKAYQNLS